MKKLRASYNFLLCTLRGRLILSVAVVHAVMMSLFITDLTTRQRAMFLERRSDEAEALSKTLATTAAGWLAASDIAGLQELVMAQQPHPELAFALLADEDGRVMAHTDRTKIGQYLLDLPNEIRKTVISKTPDLVDVAVPAMLGGQYVGWARVGIGQKDDGAKLAEIARTGELYTLVAILTGSLMASLLGYRITRRL